MSSRPHLLLAAAAALATSASARKPSTERLRFAAEQIDVHVWAPRTIVILGRHDIPIPSAQELAVDAATAKAVRAATTAKAKADAARKARAKQVPALAKAEKAARRKALALLANAERGAAAELAYGRLLTLEAYDAADDALAACGDDDLCADAAVPAIGPAREAFQRCATLGKGTARAGECHYLIGVEHELAGAGADAEAAYRAALGDAPGALGDELHARLALLELSTGRLDAALADAQAVGAGPRAAVATNVRAWANFHKGRCEDTLLAAAALRATPEWQDLGPEVEHAEHLCVRDPAHDLQARARELDPGLGAPSATLDAELTDYFAIPAGARDSVLWAVRTCAETAAGRRLAASTKLTLSGKANQLAIAGAPADLAADVQACARARLRSRVVGAVVDGTMILTRSDQR